MGEKQTGGDQARRRPAVERQSVNLEDILRAGERLGAPEEPPPARRRLKRVGTDVPVGQLNVRATVRDLDKFTAWCERQRYTYREGLAVLVAKIED